MTLGLLRARTTEWSPLAPLAHTTTSDSGQLRCPLHGHLSLYGHIWTCNYHAPEPRMNKGPHLALLAHVAMSSDNVVHMPTLHAQTTGRPLVAPLAQDLTGTAITSNFTLV